MTGEVQESAAQGKTMVRGGDTVRASAREWV
jgi:hypothetical protein